MAARTSCFAFKGKNEDLREIGEQLGVRDGARGQRAQGGEPAPHHRAADRGGRRLPPLVRALRPRAGGRVRDPGRDRARDRGPAAAHVRRANATAVRATTAEVEAYELVVSRARARDPAWPADPRGRHVLRAGDRARLRIRRPPTPVSETRFESRRSTDSARPPNAFRSHARR